MKRFITAFNGARDLYMLPLALHEEGMLESHLTDFYTPGWLAKSRIKVFEIRRRRHIHGLPFRKTKLVGDALSALVRTKLFGEELNYKEVDQAFGMRALELHYETGADLFLHSGYAVEAFAALAGREVHKCLFQFHPHALSCYEILRDDFEKHPEISWSFANEEDTNLSLRNEGGLSSTIEWQLADRIYAASSFTKKTLIMQGCNENKIVVSPYGAMLKNVDVNIRAEKNDCCSFLFVGQGVQRKGIHHLLKAWKAAGLKRSRLIIVTRKLDPGLSLLLEQQAIKVYQGVSERELELIYASSDVFVMPSLVEGFGLVYLEALSRGLHCIGTANTGLPDLGAPKISSTIVAPGDIEGLTHVLVESERSWSKRDLDRKTISESVSRHTWDRHRHRITDDLKNWLKAHEGQR